jgi:hypothetical protein
MERPACGRCQRPFTSEHARDYHMVMCTKVTPERDGQRRSVKDFFPSDDEDSIELLFFSDKNLQICSKERTIHSLQKRLGVSVTEFIGKQLCQDENKISGKRKSTKKKTKREETAKRRVERRKMQPEERTRHPHKIQCDCCTKSQSAQVNSTSSTASTATSSDESSHAMDSVTAYCKENFFILPGQKTVHFSGF